MVSYGSLNHVTINIVLLLKQLGDSIHIPLGQFNPEVDIAGHPRNGVEVRRISAGRHIGNAGFSQSHGDRFQDD
jgi:hypothetical protein